MGSWRSSFGETLRSSNILAVAVGLALTGKKLDQLFYRVGVLCGDSELAEGSIWKAFQYAACARRKAAVFRLSKTRPASTARP
jgi:transketolase N-terminal domain/subunit